MKQAYPIILTPSEHGYVVYVPDLDINTEGKDPADAIDMAADAIGLWGISAQALGREIPAPSAALPVCAPPQMAAYALVDLDAYHGNPVCLPRRPGLRRGGPFHVSDSDTGSVACSCRKVPRYSRLSVSAEPLTVVPRLS